MLELNKPKVCRKCGKTKIFNSSNFPLDKSKRLGLKYTCKTCENSRPTKSSKDKATKRYKSYKKSDIGKGRKFQLSKSFIRANLDNVCVYCGFPSTGLDRVDNTKGHTEDNCVPCCKECNIARMDNFTHDEMIIVGRAIRMVKELRLHGIKTIPCST